MSLRCKTLGHNWKGWGDMSYGEYLALYPRTYCERCNSKKNTDTGEVFHP